jgi:hypothetical protein
MMCWCVFLKNFFWQFLLDVPHNQHDIVFDGLVLEISIDNTFAELKRGALFCESNHCIAAIVGCCHIHFGSQEYPGNAMVYFFYLQASRQASINPFQEFHKHDWP